MKETEGDGVARLTSLAAMRDSLRAGLAKSRAMSTAAAGMGPCLDKTRQRLPSLSAAVRPVLAGRDALTAASGHIRRAIAPAAEALKIFDAVHGLEPLLLSDPRADLPGYLTVLDRLEDALRFLSRDCPLAVSWLHDILDYLSDNSLVDSRFVSASKSSIPAAGDLSGGLLSIALNKLESEFLRLLSDHSTPSSDLTSPLHSSTVQNLAAILQRLVANNRLDRCLAIYIDLRSSNVRAILKHLGLDYLETSTAEFDDVQSIVPHIDRWRQHLEFAVKHLAESENKLCSEVFNCSAPHVSAACFADIAVQAGMLAFIRFGRTVTESKKDPVKLLKLLDIFSTLYKLRLDFNRLFGGNARTEVQNQTRDLIKRVIEGACEVFWELLDQVELQRQMPPPVDGSVPKLVIFVTNYCNQLLGDEYRPVLILVLSIHSSWRKETFTETSLNTALLNIVKALEANLEEWSKGYDDISLSHVFLMNAHRHFSKHFKGTKLGEVIGDVWLREREQYKEHYLAMFMRETWGKLPAHLSREGLILFSGGRATARDLVKKRLKAFNEAFEDMYQTQLNWVISDGDFREKVCQMIVQAIIPTYRNYMQNYGPLVEQSTSSSKYAKYTSQMLEKQLGSLFQPGKSQSFRVRHPNGKINGPVGSQYCSASSVI